MGTTNADRISKLVNKLGPVEANKNKYTEQYNELVNEITSLLTTNIVDAANEAMSKPAPRTKKAKSGELSSRILTALSKSPGQTLEQIAAHLKVRAQAISVALYHLGKKENVFQKGDKYFMAPTEPEALPAAAKSVPYVTPDDNEEDTE